MCVTPGELDSPDVCYNRGVWKSLWTPLNAHSFSQSDNPVKSHKIS